MPILVFPPWLLFIFESWCPSAAVCNISLSEHLDDFKFRFVKFQETALPLQPFGHFDLPILALWPVLGLGAYIVTAVK